MFRGVTLTNSFRKKKHSNETKKIRSLQSISINRPTESFITTWVKKQITITTNYCIVYPICLHQTAAPLLSLISQGLNFLLMITAQFIKLSITANI
jgi:hypothetical protein